MCYNYDHMKALDLTKALKKYRSGWVAIDEKQSTVVAHAKDFDAINKKVVNRRDVFVMPASDEYYGFIT